MPFLHPLEQVCRGTYETFLRFSFELLRRLVSQLETGKISVKTAACATCLAGVTAWV